MGYPQGVIRADPLNQRAINLCQELMAHLKPEDIPAELCVVLGGDGYLLKVISELSSEFTYLGLNAGHLGFMLNEVSDIAGVAEKIKAASYTVREVPRLEVVAEDMDGSTFVGTALNDAYMERMTGQTSHLRVVVDGVTVVERMSCDGIIAATALGSTAYSFSAGGPACHPSVRVIQLTTICPHRPKLPPITLPPQAVIEVEVIDGHRRPTRVVVDGVDHDNVLKVRITEHPAEIRMAWLEGHNPTANLIRKLVLPFSDR